MANVKLKDVIRRANTKVDKDNTDLIYYVGGEHIESEQIRVEKRGIIAGSTIGPMFYYGFKKGDFLLVSRNPHLKKAGIVDFDGICSEKTFVLESSNPEVLAPEFLPFILQNERFWGYAYQHRHGSTNTFINWSALADYEFELPILEEQHRLANVLWSVVDTMKAYKKLLSATDELVKSQFIELFGLLPEQFKHDTVELGSIADMVSGGTPSSKHPEYYGDRYPFVTTPCLGNNYISEEDAANWLSESGVQHSSTHIIPPYSVMYGSRVGVGKSSINTCEMCTNQDVLSFYNIDTSRYDLLFIKKVMDQYFDYIDTQKRGATIKGVPSDVVKAIRIPIVPIEEQRAFAKFTEQSDKSKFELNRALDELTATYKQIIKDNLG